MANWSAQPLVTTRGHLLLAAGGVVAAMLVQAGLRGGEVPERAAAPVIAPPTPQPPQAAASIAPPHPVTGTLGEPPAVVGIVGRLPGNAVVLVRAAGGTQPVAVGGSSGDWTLVELAPTEAVFERNGARRMVELPASE